LILPPPTLQPVADEDRVALVEMRPSSRGSLAEEGEVETYRLVLPLIALREAGVDGDGDVVHGGP
jgi:hypothetical protein